MEPPRPNYTDEYTPLKVCCKNCGFVGDAIEHKRGSTGITIVLLLFYFIPGIIYAIWRSSTKQNRCASCRSPNTVPFSSPAGKAIVAQIENGGMWQSGG